jgi:peptide/nickel transport system ATP-binding protein
LQNSGNEIAMIFQEPMSSLNPSKCGVQVQEILLQHTKLSSQETKAETLLLFKKVNC